MNFKFIDQIFASIAMKSVNNIFDVNIEELMRKIDQPFVHFV